MTRVEGHTAEDVNLASQDKPKDHPTFSKSFIADSDEGENKTAHLSKTGEVAQEKLQNKDLSLSKTGEMVQDKLQNKDLSLTIKMLLEDFIDRYKLLVFSPRAEIEATAANCRMIMQVVGVQQFEIGQDVIYLSLDAVAQLNNLGTQDKSSTYQTITEQDSLVIPRPKLDTKPGPRTTSKILDPAGLMKTDLDKLVESSPASTLSTRSGSRPPRESTGVSRTELERNVLRANQKRQDRRSAEPVKKGTDSMEPDGNSKQRVKSFPDKKSPLSYDSYRPDQISSNYDSLTVKSQAYNQLRGSRTSGVASDEEFTAHLRPPRPHSRNSNRPSSEQTLNTSSTDNSSSHRTMEDNNETAWDVFRSVSRKAETFYESTTNWFQVVAKTVKVIAYVVIFLAVLSSAIASKAGLLLMTQAVGNTSLGSSNRDRWVYLIISAVCFPYLITFIESLGKALFGNLAGPSFWSLLWVLLVETIHSLGMCLFLFRVLPCLDVIRCLLLMNALCIIPALLRLLTTSRSDNFKRKVVTLVLDILALLMQLSAIVVAVASMKSYCIPTPSPACADNTTCESFPGNNATKELLGAAGCGPLKQQPPGDARDLSSLSWEIPLSLVLISVQWWENFCDKQDIRLGSFTLSIRDFKDSLHRSRVKCYILASLWKIGVTFGFAFLFVPDLQMIDKAFGPVLKIPSEFTVFNGTCDLSQLPAGLLSYQLLSSDVSIAESRFTSLGSSLCPTNSTDLRGCSTQVLYRWQQWHTYLPLLVQVATTGLCYYFARLACKLCMQRISFSVPLSLATPLSTAIVILVWYIKSEQLKPMVGFLEWSYPDRHEDTPWLIWHLVLGFGLWWTSQLWVSRYIWTPKAPRLAFTERLFLLPQYCGAFIEQSLLLNRRRNDKERILKEMPLPDDISMDSSSTDATLRRHREHVVPKIFVCATMWHETEREMTDLLMSVFRMDMDQSARKNAQDYFNVQDPDFYEFEAHIFVDDAMEFTGQGHSLPNLFVKQLVAVVDEAASAIHESDIHLLPPVKVPTPYGGRLVWTLPGGNVLTAHMKDKHKIRHKKRWSQVMYMYYLLGYRLLGQEDDSLNTSTVERNTDKWKSSNHFVKGNLFKYIPERVLVQAENTFILALDGDVDFKPNAVQLLVDRMKKNKKVGAACGRIHPVGGGAMVWYQIFEYAVGHWLQKAAEHMLGCVLCSPGCFSLFRGSALMDDNVMRTYATKSMEARHYLQFDQGEDRWLSTLLLQQGYKMEYCAASDAMTHCPEGFNEFFNQRRRWIPSTLANIMDLLQSFRTTVTANDNISYLYMAYQALLMLSTVLGPATILLMIAGAVNAVWKTEDLWLIYLLVVGPVAVYLVLCFMTKSNTQLNMAAVLSAIYSLVMMAVIVGTIIQITDDTVISPNIIFLIMTAAIFVLSASFHPQEFFCLLPGALYFLALPSGYVLLMIYAMCNIHVVSWGTRETSSQEMKAQLKQQLTPKSSGGFSGWIHRQEEESACCGRFFGALRRMCGSSSSDLNTEILRQVIEKLDKVEAGMKSVANTNSNFQHNRKRSSSRSRHSRKSNKSTTISHIREEAENGDASSSSSPGLSEDEMYFDVDRDELINPRWLEDEGLKDGMVHYLSVREVEFWQRCIAKYLHPISPDKSTEAKILVDLKSLRNNIAFAFFMMNAFWMVIIFMLQRVTDKVAVIIPREGTNDLKVEPLGLIFLSVFALILVLQFVAMLRHRYGTLLHILASTELRVNKKKFNQKQAIRDIVEYAMKMQKLNEFDEDLTDQDYEYTSSSEGRPHSYDTRGRKLYPESGGVYMSSGSLATQGSDTPLKPSGDANSYPLMYDNHGYQETVVKSKADPAATEEKVVKEDGDGEKKKNKASKLGRSKSNVVDKNNTLRRQFERRYKRMLKQHSNEMGQDPDYDPFRSRSLRETRRSNKRESLEEVVARFNDFSR